MSDARPLTLTPPPVQAPPRFSPPASPSVESEATASAEEPHRKHHDDGFLAAATLGGAFGSIAILILAPICIFAFTKVKAAMVEEEPAVVATEPAPTPADVASLPEEPEVPAIDVKWPEIVLTGILAGDQGRAGSVILNGEVVNLNQRLLGVRVMDFTSQQVVLEYQGAQKTLQVGGSTL